MTETTRIVLLSLTVAFQAITLILLFKMTVLNRILEDRRWRAMVRRQNAEQDAERAELDRKRARLHEEFLARHRITEDDYPHVGEG